MGGEELEKGGNLGMGENWREKGSIGGTPEGRQSSRLDYTTIKTVLEEEGKSMTDQGGTRGRRLSSRIISIF